MTQSTQSKQALKDLIDAKLTKFDHITRLDRALTLADEEMFIPESGERPGVPSVMGSDDRWKDKQS